MRIVALTTPGRAHVLRTAEREHEVLAVGDPASAAVEAHRGCDVLLLDGRAPGARALASQVRADPDLLGTAVLVLLDEAEAVVDWEPVVDDVLVGETAQAEVLTRVRSAGRLAALRVELHDRTLALEELAYSDALTGLPNRRYLMGRLDALLSAARRHEHRLTVLLADLDHFKQVNDRLGHETGDRLLVAAAEGMRGRLRTEDVVGRWGGDEFLALLPETGAASARAGAERLRVAVTRELRALAPDLGVGLSLGLATWDGHEDAEALLRRVDEALYAAKRGGRGRLAHAT